MDFPTAPTGPLQNWNDFRVRLAWAYDGPVARYRSHEYLPQPTPAWLIRRGTVTLRFATGKEHYRAGMWVFPKNVEGWQEFSADAEILSLRVVAEWPTSEPLFNRSRSYTLNARERPEFTRISERLVRYVHQNFPGVTVELPYMAGTPRKYFHMQRLVYGWLIAYAEVMEQFGLAPHTIEQLDQRVREAVHELEMRPLNQSLRERELAERVGLSPSQLNKLFVRELGKTPAEYWRQRRIRSARLALAASERSIKSIAFDLGFSSLPHFSAWVAKTLGKSPREFRRA